MRLRTAAPPFVREGPTVGSMLGWTSFALCALLVIPAARYGPRPLAVAGASVLACALCECLANLLRGKGPALSDGSSAVTGLICALMMPLNAPAWLPCAAGAFAVLVAKAPFGGFGRNPFNPAAAGVSFAALCWPDLVSACFDPAKPYALPAFGAAVFERGETPASVLKNGLKPDILPLDLLWGTAPGALGTGAALVLCACALLLFFTRSAHWEGAAGFLASAALLAALFPRIACGPLTSVKYELLSGALLFSAVFLAADPVTSPRMPAGRFCFGALAGALLMAFRRFGAAEADAGFAVLAADAAVPLIDALSEKFRGWEAKPHG